MSKLYASIDSDARKTQATSRGHRSISAHVRGWDVGVSVEARVDDDGEVVLYVYRTSGSNGAGSSKLIAEVRDA